mmetsp:Transcript_8380/g.13222  ORF Transcript_8380/g.13222 Transcript_8380/m.13222 type:complete len:419 (+) Transcript_8380:28-1284(+)
MSGLRMRGATGLRAQQGAMLTALLLGILGAVVLVSSGAWSRGLSSRVARSELVEEVPTAVTDLEAKVDVAGKKAWMTDIFNAASGKTQLHPNANIDPFTGQPAEDDYESHLRAEATKAIADKIQQEAQAEISSAQQAARDYAGSDAGCTHENLNQTDYSGDVALTVTNDDCMPWADAESEGLTAVYTAAAYPELTGNACRNPGAARLGSWCYKATALVADPSDAEGVNWAYCDIGRRCKIDMPLLKPVKGAKGAVLKKPTQAPSTEAQSNVLRQKNGQILAKRTHGVVANTQLQHHQLARKPKVGLVHSLTNHQQMARHHKQPEGHSLTPHHQLARPTKHPRGRTTHQQLAWLSFAQSKPREPYNWDDGISGPIARKQLKHRDWFLLDKHMRRFKDTGIDAPMSDKDARKSLDEIFKD